MVTLPSPHATPHQVQAAEVVAVEALADTDKCIVHLSGGTTLIVFQSVAATVTALGT
jgi:hypothetical protein